MVMGVFGKTGAAVAVLSLLQVAACVPVPPASTATDQAPTAAANPSSPVIPTPVVIAPELQEAIWSFDSVCVRNAGDLAGVRAAARAVGFRVRTSQDGSLRGTRRTRLGPEQEFRAEQGDTSWRCDLSVLSDLDYPRAALDRLIRQELGMTIFREDGQAYRYRHTSRPRATRGMLMSEHEFSVRSF